MGAQLGPLGIDVSISTLWMLGLTQWYKSHSCFSSSTLTKLMRKFREICNFRIKLRKIAHFAIFFIFLRKWQFSLFPNACFTVLRASTNNGMSKCWNIYVFFTPQPKSFSHKESKNAISKCWTIWKTSVWPFKRQNIFNEQKEKKYDHLLQVLASGRCLLKKVFREMYLKCHSHFHFL